MIAFLLCKTLNSKLRTVLVTALAAFAVEATPAAAVGSEQLPHILVSGLTQAPPGWIAFCAQQPGECSEPTTTARELALSRETWMDLVRVNNWVNDTIKPLSDLKHWGVAERWSYPDDGYGDCEDYVLLKRRMLIHAGWPRETLLVTVVRDDRGEGHAVLTVITDEGDYILDNQKKDILIWSDTGYHFIKRQSQSNPNVWVSLGDQNPATATATSRK